MQYLCRLKGNAYFCILGMEPLHVITPVKDAVPSTLETVRAVLSSQMSVPFTYTLYNDFSSPDNTRLLEEASRKMGFQLVNLSDLTTHPSPNYLLVLRHERRLCLEAGCHLLIVESDVIVRPDTLQGLVDGASQPAAGLVASVTVDEGGQRNYPYEFARKMPGKVEDTRHHLSFCCTLLTNELLQKVDFEKLDDTKSWFDVTISHLSLDAELHNYLMLQLPVLHRPHASRPWKKLKYTNPLKYYWKKYTHGLDKI